MKNTINEYPPSPTVTKKKDCSTIVLEKHSIKLEMHLRDSIQRKSSRA